ncbi:LysR substrate-binding domain-containing protein [Cupriavidus sp. CV2]|uniref:LysR substrate-binding domain-containing protein n=1 Tax=Cupriavidus ulmosensis TaxID=3065913 RepID=UPI00296A99D1|nr:LysR substrate-binding domain-containing protein [Cupriavidus sp. CV2]MDW3685457.1 LysR substrate-binding domain-containing protein [Cupriavidus sp. CV2]
MTLQQLRCIQAVIASNLSVSRAADALHTTQPAVSKLIRSLENEIGVELFVRRGNRLVALTDAGQEAAALSRRVLNDTRALTNLAQANLATSSGTLRVGTTHIHARYALLDVIRRFSAAHPAVNLELLQGTPAEIVQWVAEGAVALGVSTLPQKTPEGIITLEAYPIPRCLIVPKRHPLLKLNKVTIEDIAQYPLVTYDEHFNSGWVVMREFQRKGLSPRVVVRATDANVIKAYVAAGLGVAVVQQMAVEPARDIDLAVIDTKGIFPASMAAISLRDDQYVRGYMQDFIGMISPKGAAQIQGLAAGAARAGSGA